MSSSSTDANDGCKYNIDDITEDLGEAIIAKDEDKIVDVSTTEQACAAKNDDKGDIIDTKADNDDSVECSLCGWGQTKKTCISCAQKIELAKILEQVINNDTQNNNTDTCSIEQDELDGMSKCASCGKEGNSDDMNTCNKCKSVKYCNAACKKKHRKKHKKACEKRVAELHDLALFKEPPPREECPICMLTLPINANESVFKSCCGKTICNGCDHAMLVRGKNLCPYCRIPPARSKEEEQTKKLMDKGIAQSFNHMGGLVMSRDMTKAIGFWLKGGKLGCALSNYNLGQAYKDGIGVERDEKKAKHYYELAAMMGHVNARHNLGCNEGLADNYHRAMKHLILAAKAGNKASLDNVKEGLMVGIVTKDEYASTLRAYHERQEDMKSDAREKAAENKAAKVLANRTR